MARQLSYWKQPEMTSEHASCPSTTKAHRKWAHRWLLRAVVLHINNFLASCVRIAVPKASLLTVKAKFGYFFFLPFRKKCQDRKSKLSQARLHNHTWHRKTVMGISHRSGRKTLPAP